MSERITAVTMNDPIMKNLRPMLEKLVEMNFTPEQVADACLLAFSSLEIKRVGLEAHTERMIVYAKSLLANVKLQEPLSKSEKESLN